jgi:hypothetical protein
MSDEQETEDRQHHEDDPRRRREAERFEEGDDSEGRDGRERDPPDVARREAGTTGQVDIPDVDFSDAGDASIEDVDASDPQIEEDGDRELSVPVTGIEPVRVEVAEVELDREVPEIEGGSATLEPPVVQLGAKPSVRIQLDSFDREIKKRSVSDDRQVSVPLYRKPATPSVRAIISELERAVDPTVQSVIESYGSLEGVEDAGVNELERRESVDPLSAKSTGSIEFGGGDTGMVDADALPDPLELIFSGGGDIYGDGPVVIGMESGASHIGALRRLCQRIYREKVGGNPTPTIIRDLDMLVGDRAGGGEIKWMEAEGNIFSVQLDNEEWDTLFEHREKDWERLWNRIDELFAEEFGFIIFNDCIDRVPAGEEFPTIRPIHITPLEAPKSVQKRLASLCWGFVEVSEAEQFDMMFQIARKRFNERLEEAGHLEGGMVRDATDENEGEESDLHIRLKWFIVRVLTEQLRDQGVEITNPLDVEEVVETEVQVYVGGDEGTIADIKQGQDVFEVETLFAQDRGGRDPRNKLQETFRKYAGSAKIDTVHVVLDSLTFYRHIDNIVELKRNYEDWEDEEGIDVRFETVDVADQKLVEMDEAINRLRAVEEALPVGDTI